MFCLILVQLESVHLVQCSSLLRYCLVRFEPSAPAGTAVSLTSATAPSSEASAFESVRSASLVARLGEPLLSDVLSILARALTAVTAGEVSRLENPQAIECLFAFLRRMSFCCLMIISDKMLEFIEIYKSTCMDIYVECWKELLALLDAYEEQSAVFARLCDFIALCVRADSQFASLVSSKYVYV